MPDSRYLCPIPTVRTTETSSETAVASFALLPASKAASERSAARQRIEEEMPAATKEWRDLEFAQAMMPPAARAPA